MMRQIPIFLGVLALVGLTVAEARMSGRFQGSNMTEAEFAALLKNVPEDIGDWHGTDLPVEEQVKMTSGARGYVSRSYKNALTGETVTVWLIVGHAKDVMRHTPDVCYPSSGFTTRAPENSLQSFVFDGKNMGDFYTNTFVKEDSMGRQLIRVFWSWYKPSEDGKVEWKAPKIVRWEFGNAPSLYKLYFTSNMHDFRETTEESPCMKFAKLFLPVVDKALSSAQQSAPAAEPEAKPAADDSSTT
jgi:Protein of unknown function (DUF3485)